MTKIRVQNLSLVKEKKSREFSLLRDVCLEIPTGRTTLLLGKSGAGKTSILRCISQLEKNYEGEILYGGKNLAHLSRKQRCQILGFVPQSYALFPSLSVLDNCAHPLRTILGYGKREAYERAEESLAAFEMGKFLSSFPHEISSGQQQRTSIIRALLLDPAFLLLDEPTSALDPENSELLLQLILQLKAKAKGVVISSQDMSFARKILDRVYFLEQGKIVESHEAVASLPKESRLNAFLLQTPKHNTFSCAEGGDSSIFPSSLLAKVAELADALP